MVWPTLTHPRMGTHRFFLLGLRHQHFYETGLLETGMRIWPLNFFLVQARAPDKTEPRLRPPLV